MYIDTFFLYIMTGTKRSIAREEPEPEPVPVQPIEPPEVSEEEWVHLALMRTQALIDLPLRRLAEWTAHCEKRLNKMPKRISHIANGESPLHYLSTICQTFHKSYGSNLVDALDMINACIIDVSEVRKSAQKWLERYKTAIQDDETAFLQQGMQIVEEIEALVRFLEGLLCVAMVRPEDIKEYYVQGKHAFQDDTVKFIVLK